MVGAFDICARVQNGFRARLARIAIPETNLNLSISRILYNQGFIYSVTRGNHLGPDKEYTSTTNLNVADRRLWLSLKYFNDMPVLTKMNCISKPSRRLSATTQELARLATGKAVGIVKPVIPGEIVIVSTPKGVMEINEAVKMGLGGVLLARAS
ncbi:37S ribosomal protein subunit S8, mitochondrial [Zancudomyces culisetae]|uniref:37S ribosomal protein subunit S8, mitochondrial n=1 Tax=Zancudomyces culisetae TaxID=1213189 RepID=A0A1R1PEX7_ZANCU|nr:37S ribosomal protein subunit S8, mitochondrial [Zancudomyces culisetae]|eukprot:OMH79550.1 37S ribosomal protein subunit S8, mitochondrial [Zancudomyces culisetae]